MLRHGDGEDAESKVIVAWLRETELGGKMC